MSEINAKLVKQLEYYFGDINVTKDKHLKQLISSAVDGWVSYDDLLKFPRLNSISNDKEIIRLSVQNSGSKIIEANENGIRRYLDLEIPTDIQAVTEIHLDKSVYVKGFNPDITIDEIIEYLETFGGPTLSVYMRRILKSKSFKGSVFAIFKEKEDAEKFLFNKEASKFMDNDMISMWQTDYLASKKRENVVKHEEKEIRLKTVSANREALLDSKMTKGALLELSGFDVITSENFEGNVSADFTDNRDTRTATQNLKLWLSNLLSDVAPVSWVEYFPATNKVIVRLGRENAAIQVLEKFNILGDVSKKSADFKLKSEDSELKLADSELKLADSELKLADSELKLEDSELKLEDSELKTEDNVVLPEVTSYAVKFKYQVYTLEGTVLSGEAEKDYWRNILNEQSKKTKRFGGRGGRTGGPDRKRMRR